MTPLDSLLMHIFSLACFQGKFPVTFHHLLSLTISWNGVNFCQLLKAIF